MIQIKVNEILKKQKKTKYWFIKKMEGGYQSMSRLLENETESISFDTLDRICDVLDCEVGDVLVHKKGKSKK